MRSPWLIVVMYCALGLAQPAVVYGQAEVGATASRHDGPPITFSNLIVRVEERDEIARASSDYRVIALETMRNDGFNAVGAENLVFGRDHAADAEFVLGGTMREAKCKRSGQTAQCCRIGVEWQLLDVASDQVVYRALTRHGECELDGLDDAALTRHFVVSALRKLLRRGRFNAALEARRSTADSAVHEPLAFERCTREPEPIASNADTALDATVLVTSGMAHGSGFFLTGSGLVLTAAHVVTANSVTLRTRDGSSYTALPLRISRKFDVALLRAQLPQGQREECLPLATDVKPGNEIYAIGAPAERELAFSLTRGIASGLRELRGVSVVQTDAPVSPGNSGGPLLDGRGRVVAVVSQKIVGNAVEGVSFGVTTAAALQALGLTPGSSGAPALLSMPALKLTHSDTNTFVDTEDPLPKLEPAAAATADVPRRFILEQGFDSSSQYRYFRGRFYLDSALYMTAFVAPRYAAGRFVVSLNRSQRIPTDPACKSVELVINGRSYPALEAAEATKAVPPLHRGIARGMGTGWGIEARFDVALLARLEEYAPSLRLRTCGGDWALTRAQLTEFRKLKRAYEALLTGK